MAVWSMEATMFLGELSASGGVGAGGFAEVSSAGRLTYRGTADLSGAHGLGTLLLDPRVVTIETAAGSPDDRILLARGAIGFDYRDGEEITISEQALESAKSNLLIQATDSIVVGVIADGRISLPTNVTLTLQTNNDGTSNQTGGVVFRNVNTILSASGAGGIVVQAGVRADSGGHVQGRKGEAVIDAGVLQTQRGAIVLEATGEVRLHHALATTGGAVRIDGDAGDLGTGRIVLQGAISTSGASRCASLWL